MRNLENLELPDYANENSAEIATPPMRRVIPLRDRLSFMLISTGLGMFSGMITAIPFMAFHPNLQAIPLLAGPAFGLSVGISALIEPYTRRR